MKTRHDHERRQGYKDAMSDLEIMLSCPVCRAIQHLQATEPTLGYGAGWRLAMIEVKNLWQHTCPEFYQRKESEVIVQ